MNRLPEVWRPSARRQYSGPALLDTHIWVWYLDGAGDRLSTWAVEMLRRCARGGGLLVSDISVWELGTKSAKGKLSFIPNVDAWISRASRRPGFSFQPLDRDILLYSTRLPGVPHGDPADRMLIATAALLGAPLVTVDELILHYATSTRGVFSACDARRRA